MNQIKTGSFIASCRRAMGWTQNQMAEKLGVTDKAVSKWETGRSMPDLSLLIPLCGLLGISLNELFSGEYIAEENLKTKADEVLMDVIAAWLGQDKWRPEENSGPSACMLHIENVTKIFETQGISTTAVDDVSFQIPRSSFTGIMGASGSGKTTLLNLIAAIDRPTAGTIHINGQSITQIPEKDLARFRREHLGFIFQDYNLLDTLTIYENIALALTVKEVPKETIRPTIAEISDRLDISSILHKYPCEVSGGQRQRCACARAIAVNPSVILADEPTGALNFHSAKQLLDTLALLRADYSATILMVTHDALSASYCDRILFMKDGRIKKILFRQEETKQSFFTRILEVTAQLAGDENLDGLSQTAHSCNNAGESCEMLGG